jgi:hypothetical protein
MTLTMSAAYVCTFVQYIMQETEMLAIQRWIDFVRVHILRLCLGLGIFDLFFNEAKMANLNFVVTECV